MSQIAGIDVEPAVNSDAWWAERGVSDDVRGARPYVRWTIDDLEPVREAYDGLSEAQLRTLLRWARQSDGLVIYRHSFERVAADDPRRVYPEIRPDHAVCTETVWHYHGPARGEPPRHPTTGKPLRSERIHSPDAIPGHIARDRDPDDHRGINADEVHAHRAMAKYLFPPNARGLGVWIDHHYKREQWAAARSSRMARTPEEGERNRLAYKQRFQAHLERHHGGEDVWGYHVHPFSAKVRGEQLAKRIDVNPLVWKRGGFEQAERVFFGIEGCIKADAILTALLAAGEPPAVFSVPSVSLWEATYPADEDELEDGDELAAFAYDHLLDKLVCIVPDADAHTKDEVMTQALLCRSTLRRLGARAEIVLPPDDRLGDGIKGVDDYLGKGGGTLDGLVWYRKEPPSVEELVSWLLGRSRTAGWKRDRLQRAAETLQALATHAGEQGEYSASLRLLARATGRQGRNSNRYQNDDIDLEVVRARDANAAAKRFERGFHDLLAIGAISSNKPLSVRQERWLRQQNGWQLERGLHWIEDGVVITVHEELRARAERRSARDL